MELSLPNEIIIIIYNYANVETKYKLILIYRWLLKIKLKCDNNSGDCKDNANYILQFRINLTHSNGEAIYISDNKTGCETGCYPSSKDDDIITLTKVTCSLKCKKTLTLENDTNKFIKANNTNSISKVCMNDTYIRCHIRGHIRDHINDHIKDNIIDNIIDNLNENTNSVWYLLNYLTCYGSFYYGNGYGDEWYNTDYRIQYCSKNYKNNTISLEYYIYNQDKCFSCHQNIFSDLVTVKGFLLC